MADDLGDEWWERESAAAASSPGPSDGGGDTMQEPPEETQKPKECFLIQPNPTKEGARKAKKRRKKKITDVLAKSEPKPGTPEDLQKLMKDYYSSCRSVIELEELSFPDSCFLKANDLTHSLSSYLKEICPKWVKLRKSHSEKKSVLMLIVCSSAVRALELIRSLTAFKGDGKVMKLFAKHIKVQEQIKLLEKHVVHLGVGTPGRIKELIKQGGLNLNPLKFLVFDWNWRDQKLRRMMDIPEIRKEVFELLDMEVLSLCKTEMEVVPEEEESRLEDSSALKQQMLPACKLRFSLTVVLSIYIATGVFCISVGTILLVSAKNIRKIEINYTNKCANCAQMRENALNFDQECTCSIPFRLQENMEGDVYMYYKLQGFYQNLYRYILSRSNRQLMSKDLLDVEDCAPFKVSHDKTPIVPCGAIANSMFNDTIVLSYTLNSSVHIRVPMLKNGLAWWTDKYVKFRNPNTNNLTKEFAGSTKPPYWPKPIYELDNDDPGNNGFLNEDFIVWMRTAAFPTFKKLYGRLFRVHYFAHGLPAGNYSFHISYNFPVTRFQGEKAVVLSTLTWSGGSSLFLGLTYTITGILTLLASVVIWIISLMKKKHKSVSPQESSQDLPSRKAKVNSALSVPKSFLH